MNHVGPLAVVGQPLRERRVKELAERPYASLFRHLRDIASRFDAQHRNARLPRSSAANSHRCWRSPPQGSAAPDVAAWTSCDVELARMTQHRVRERREVRVFAEQLLRWYRFGDLDERAMRTENQFERIRRLGSGQLFGLQQRIGQRRVPQRQHGL